MSNKVQDHFSLQDIAIHYESAHIVILPSMLMNMRVLPRQSRYLSFLWTCQLHIVINSLHLVHFVIQNYPDVCTLSVISTRAVLCLDKGQMKISENNFIRLMLNVLWLSPQARV